MRSSFLITFWAVLLSLTSHVSLFAGDRAHEIAPKNIGIIVRGITLHEQQRVNGNYKITKSETIRLPYIEQALSVAGLSLPEIARKIEDAYKSHQIYANPVVSVIPQNSPGCILMVNRIAVGGFVKNPGPIRYQPKMTLLQAVNAAGGATPFGSFRRVQLHRGGKRYLYDLKNPIHQKVQVHAHDMINVPQRHHG